jgi:hypothetical protein
MIKIKAPDDPCHAPTCLYSLTLLVKNMKPNKKKGSLPFPEEAPAVPPAPEVIPPAEPLTPVIPVEEPPVKPAERPEKISPYDFPPPGEGFFPEIFE